MRQAGLYWQPRKKLGVCNEDQEKYGALNSGDKSERVDVKLEIAEWVRGERKQQSQQSNVVGGERSESKVYEVVRKITDSKDPGERNSLTTSMHSMDKHNPLNWPCVVFGWLVWVILVWSPPSSAGIVEGFLPTIVVSERAD
jgi:hypothetical protein